MSIGKPQTKPEQLDYVGRKQPFKSREKPWKGTSPRQPQKPEMCTRCGKSPEHKRQLCPAKDVEYHGCDKKGHFKAMCHSCQALRTVESSKDNQTFLGVVQQPKNDNPWNINRG